MSSHPFTPKSDDKSTRKNRFIRIPTIAAMTSGDI
jgi:hypothetical protein